jgi:hypothetical protein
MDNEKKFSVSAQNDEKTGSFTPGMLFLIQGQGSVDAQTLKGRRQMVEQVGRQEPESLTTAAAWRAWHAACALDLCKPAVVEQLRLFGSHRFRYYLNRYAARQGGGGVRLPRTPAETEVWHLLETHTQVSQSRAGKSYKKWLQSRARGQQGDDWLATMESGASLLMRDVVREFLRREGTAAFMVSTAQSIGGDGLTVEQLLPDPEQTASALLEMEDEALTDALADRLTPQLSERDGRILVASYLGIPFADADFQQWAGCSCSRAYELYQLCLRRLCEQIQLDFREESPAVWIKMAQKTSEKIKKRIFLKIFPEKASARFFRKKGKGLFLEGDEQS